MELGKHRERANERRLRHNQEHYVPAFVDMISAEPLDNGKSVLDRLITLMLLFLVFGTETAATTVEWAMAELIANLDVRKQAQEELDAVVGRNRLMQKLRILHLPFLQAIVQETPRWHTRTPLAPLRASNQSAKAWGYTISAEIQLVLNMQAVYHNCAIYANSEEFNLQSSVHRPKMNQLSVYDFHKLIPFGVGRCMCPGANFV